MNDFLIILLRIFPLFWLVITFWTMVTKKKQHWLYKGWLWFHWFILSFIFSCFITVPLMVKFFGLLIPFAIWGLSGILKALGVVSTKNYTRYNIFICVITILITFLTTENIENDEPGLFSLVVFPLLYLIFTGIFVYKIFHTKEISVLK